MTADVLDTHLVAYLRLREALGFQMRAEKILLPEFVAYVKAQERTGPIRAQTALEWACQASAHRGPSGAARRLSIARTFLSYLKASVPDTCSDLITSAARLDDSADWGWDSVRIATPFG